MRKFVKMTRLAPLRIGNIKKGVDEARPLLLVL